MNKINKSSEVYYEAEAWHCWNNCKWG